MAQVLPGTTLPLPEEAADNAFSVLTPIFAVSGGGLLLSQLILWAGSLVCSYLMAVKIFSIFVVAAVQFLLNRTFAFGKPRHKT